MFSCYEIKWVHKNGQIWEMLLVICVWAWIIFHYTVCISKCLSNKFILQIFLKSCTIIFLLKVRINKPIFNQISAVNEKKSWTMKFDGNGVGIFHVDVDAATHPRGFLECVWSSIHTWQTLLWWNKTTIFCWITTRWPQTVHCESKSYLSILLKLKCKISNGQKIF